MIYSKKQTNKTEVTTSHLAEMLLTKGVYNKKELSDELGISRPTLDSRLDGRTVWKKLEVRFIKNETNDY